MQAYTQENVERFRSKSRETITLKVNDSALVDQSAIDSIMNRVNELDFTPHGYKLQKEYGWSQEKINHTIGLYKEWLVLQVLYEYVIKGEFIHHYPYFGLTEQENETVLESGFELTKKLYMHHFGHCELGYKDEMSASCGCRSGNGGSCR